MHNSHQNNNLVLFACDVKKCRNLSNNKLSNIFLLRPTKLKRHSFVYFVKARNGICGSDNLNKMKIYHFWPGELHNRDNLLFYEPHPLNQWFHNWVLQVSSI